MPSSLKSLSFILALLGIFNLLILVNFMPSLEINSSNLKKAVNGQPFLIQGKVIKQSFFYESMILKLDNGLVISCSSCKNLDFKNKNISSKVYLDLFSGQDLKVLEIKTLD